MSGLNNILAQSVQPTVAPLPLQALQCNTMSVNQVIENVGAASGASPQTVSQPIAKIVFTGIATTVAGATVALQWTNAAITSSSIVRATLVTQSVASTAAFVIFSCVPGSGSVALTLISVGQASTGASGSATILFEQIA